MGKVNNNTHVESLNKYIYLHNNVQIKNNSVDV